MRDLWRRLAPVREAVWFSIVVYTWIVIGATLLLVLAITKYGNIAGPR